MALTADQTTFVRTITPQAVTAGARYGVRDVRPVVAQAGLETGWGRSTLTTRTKNLFNIKAGSSWAGPTVSVNALEYSAGGAAGMHKSAFRVYRNYEESFADYFALLERRYPRALTALRAGDSHTAFVALKAGGYATDPKYVAKLTSALSLTTSALAGAGAAGAGIGSSAQGGGSWSLLLMLAAAAGLVWYLSSSEDDNVDSKEPAGDVPAREAGPEAGRTDDGESGSEGESEKGLGDGSVDVDDGGCGPGLDECPADAGLDSGAGTSAWTG